MVGNGCAVLGCVRGRGHRCRWQESRFGQNREARDDAIGAGMRWFLRSVRCQRQRDDLVARADLYHVHQCRLHARQGDPAAANGKHKADHSGNCGAQARHAQRLPAGAKKANATKRAQWPCANNKSPAIKSQGLHASIGKDQAAAWAFSMSFLIFSALADSSSSLALARKASRPPR